MLKFRLSYGKIGSNPINPYQSLALMTPIRYNFNDEIITGFYESNLANDDLTWETTDQFNFGIDLGLYDSKVNITIDVYHKLTHDLLQYVDLLWSTYLDSFSFGKKILNDKTQYEYFVTSNKTAKKKNMK